MSAGWGPKGPAEPTSETGLAEVLSAFAIYGGQLAGARRSVDNPLALTHVRWQGPVGQALEAARRPGDDAWLSPGERAAWVELALHYPTAEAPAHVGPGAPWWPLSLKQDEARALSTGIARSRSSNPGASRSGLFRAPTSGTPYPPYPGANSTPRQRTRSGPQSGGFDSGARAQTPPFDVTNGWPLGQSDGREVVVIPCVEIELPVATGSIGAVGSSDFARDYAQNVAVHFARAARTIPQVRELRGWTRAGRLVLAARMVLGPGDRPPTRTEMEAAAQMLADALARRTLPYTQLNFAQPDEWEIGSAMPE
jgi:hypothetical protein